MMWPSLDENNSTLFMIFTGDSSHQKCRGVEELQQRRGRKLRKGQQQKNMFFSSPQDVKYSQQSKFDHYVQSLNHAGLSPQTTWLLGTRRFRSWAVVISAYLLVRPGPWRNLFLTYRASLPASIHLPHLLLFQFGFVFFLNKSITC